MSLDRLDFNSICEDHLQNLIDNQVPESRMLEYKREIYNFDKKGKEKEDEKGKKEFLKDVSALANTHGGHLVLGIEEKDGTPNALRALEGLKGNGDKQIQQMDLILQSGLEPRLTNVSFKAIPLSTGGYAMVIRVPTSWNRPHRVLLGGINRFYRRNTSSVYEPDTQELRMLFSERDGFLEKAQNFHAKRIAAIQQPDDDAPPLNRNGQVIIHIIPFSAFAQPVAVNVKETVKNGENVHVLYCRSSEPYQYNYLGVRFQDALNRNTRYTQFFRNGVVELVAGKLVDQYNQNMLINGEFFEQAILKGVFQNLRTLETIRLAPPFLILCSLYGVKGQFYSIGKYPETDRSALIPSFPLDNLFFPECVIESYPESEQALKVLLTPSFDFIWNALGEERCLR